MIPWEVRIDSNICCNKLEELKSCLFEDLSTDKEIRIYILLCYNCRVAHVQGVLECIETYEEGE